ncbi:hypothetical protein ES703_65510 [subsurface metagenome]
MSFQPFVIYSSRLPYLKPGHFIKAAEKMYQVVVARHNRQPLALDAGEVTSDIALNTSTDEAFQALHGKLDVGRIVQIQYLALTTGVDVIFKWMKEPLGSKWVNIVYDSAVAAVDAPVEVDRWSYDPELRLAYTKDAGAQTVYFEMVEYEVKATTLTPKRYLKILPNGQTVFIDAPV